MTVRTAVEASLSRVAEVAERDAGTAELARTYARLIDAAAPTAALARAIRTVAPNIDFSDDKVCDAWRKITDALARHSVTSDLGPKLLAALDALQLTPRARAAATGEKGDQGDRPAANPLDQLADRRRNRANRTPTVDASAPRSV